VARNRLERRTRPLPAAFKNDGFMLAAAQQEIRSKFEVGSHPVDSLPLPPLPQLPPPLPPPPLTRCWPCWCFAQPVQTSRSVTDAEQQQQLLAEGSEAADFISSSIVQAVANDRGSYGEPACRAAALAPVDPCPCCSS
jgi:hypothetical protein